jgi:predicted DNA-binding protein
MPSNSIKFTADSGTRYRFHQGALREGRSLSEYVRLCAERGLNEMPPVTIPDGDVATDSERRHNHNIVGCYLSETLSKIVSRLAKDEGRSKSRIVRDLIRSGLRKRGLLEPPAPTPTDPVDLATP